MSLHKIGADDAGAASCARTERRATPIGGALLRLAATGTRLRPFLPAAGVPLLMGLAAVIVPEPVSTCVASVSLAWLSLRAQRLRAAAADTARHRDNLARHFAPAVARLAAETDPAALRAGREQEVTVLFADIRDFTALCEGLPPREVAAFLDAFRSRAAAVIEAAGGLVDKFVGDEVMAVFGVPDAASRDADDALAAGRALVAAMRAWSREREAVGMPPVRIGIGLHRGLVFLGAIGAERVEFTVVGDTVNVARRLERVTRSLACDVIASEAVVRAAVPGQAAFLAVQTVRGRRGALRIFVVEGACPARSGRCA